MTTAITREKCTDCGALLELDEPHVVSCQGSRHVDACACRGALPAAHTTSICDTSKDDLCLACWCLHPDDVDCEGQPLEVVTIPASLMQELDEREDEIVEQAIKALSSETIVPPTYMTETADIIAARLEDLDPIGLAGVLDDEDRLASPVRDAQQQIIGARAALAFVKAQVLDHRQSVTEGPMIARIKVAHWCDKAASTAGQTTN